jgi:hypothetical protein
VTEYAGIVFQPIVQGVVTFPSGVGPGSPVEFDGEGVSNIARLAGFPNGAYVLTLDQGLPGNAGAVQPGGGFLIDPNVRTMISCRGAGAPPNSIIVTTAVLYLLSPVVGVGANQILVVMETFPPALADPPAGFEIITWVTN